ncbi:hypothetical protein Aperf_G00000126872 [Anoplocephala perfoliata]
MNECEEDITERFLNACKNCLGPGEIAHEPFFNLRYAMSAIDIMNPSMDAGMVKERKIATLRHAIESGELLLEPFTDQEVLLGVIDELIVLFVNWLTGDPLIQTVYTCMYMHCIPYIGDECLALFCEALRRNIIFFRRVLLTLPSFEDEDFCSSKNKVPLTAATEILFPTRKISNSYSDYSNEKLLELLQEQQEKLLQSGKLGKVLCSRLNLVASMLRFEKHFSDFLAVLVEEDVEEAYENSSMKDYSEPIILDPKSMPKSLQMTPELFSGTCEKILVVLTELVATSKVLFKTADLGKDAGPGKANPKSEFYWIPGFEPYLTLSALTASVQRFPRSLSTKCVFSFLGCAFSRVIRVIKEMKRLIQANPQSTVFLHEMCAVSHKLGHNICHCLFQSEELSQPLDVKDASSRSCALSRGVLSVMMGVIFKCPVNVDQRLSEALAVSNPVMHYLTSWLAVEPKWIRDRILDSALDVRNYASFLENVFLNLYKASFLRFNC